MIRRTSRGQSGITLTEILISILIMGVGMTSLLTLFPLGLLRVREASRLSRSAFLVESAGSDLGTRNLLSKASFLNGYSGIWYADQTKTYTPWPYDPWVQDTPSYLGDPIAGPFGAYRGNGSFNTNNKTPHNLAPPTGFIAGPGLPVAYDPLWRDTTGQYLGSKLTEARFGSGIGFIRNDPQGGLPSAHGLQRITNFPAGSPTNVPDIFVSPEDMVLQSNADSSQAVGTVSPIAPDLKIGGTNGITNMPNLQFDWKYTWMFTGRQSDATNGTVFDGDIVVFENRPLAVESVVAPFDTTVEYAVAGETVVEAIFGYTSNVTSGTTATTSTSKVGYGSRANRAVLLRWSDTLPDPEIRVGNWIADVTYERNAAVDFTRSVVHPTDPNDLPPSVTGGVGPAGEFFPYQRCHWYQIAKRTEAVPSSTLTGFREMTVWTSTPLKALTLLNISTGASNGTPYHVNAALVSPYVVNVFPRTIYTR